MRNATKYLRASRFGLDDAGLATVFFLAEESGSTAAVGYNQLLQQVSGTRIQKKQLANLKKMGLITSQEAEAGKVGDKTITELVGGTAVDEKTQTANLARWVSKNLIPQMRKMGLDPNKPADAAKMARLVTSDRTSTDSLTTLINRSDELAAQAKLGAGGAKAGQRKRSESILADSSVLAATSVQGQFQSLLGETVTKLEPILLPVMKGVSGTLSDVTEEIRKASTGTVAGGGLVAGGLAVAALLKAAGPLGVMAGVAGLGDEKSRPMSLAALALQGAARDLSSAADKLSGGTGILPDGTGGPDKGKQGKPSSTKIEPPKGVPWWLLALGRTGAAGLLASPFLSGSEPPAEWANATADERQRLYARDAAKFQLYVAQQQLKALDEGKTVLPGKQDKPSVVQGAVQDLARLTETRNQLTASINSLTREVARLSVEGAQVKPEGKGPDWTDLNRALKAFQKPSDTKWPDGTPTTTTPPPKWPESAVLPTPSWMPDLKASLDGATITAAASALTTSSSTFATVFSTGSVQIGAAGQTAADIISDGAASAGARYGNAAAAAIAAAAASVSINVNSNVQSKPNTGASNPD